MYSWRHFATYFLIQLVLHSFLASAKFQNVPNIPIYIYEFAPALVTCNTSSFNYIRTFPYSHFAGHTYTLEFKVSNIESIRILIISPIERFWCHGYSLYIILYLLTQLLVMRRWQNSHWVEIVLFPWKFNAFANRFVRATKCNKVNTTCKLLA